MQNSQPSQPFFNIEMKINNQKRTIPVYHTDALDDLAYRFSEMSSLTLHSDCYSTIKDKIVAYLQQVLTNPKLDRKLKDKISKFIAKSHAKNSPNKIQKPPHLIIQKTKRDQQPSAQKYTPFKLIQNQINSSSKRSSCKSKEGKNHKHQEYRAIKKNNLPNKAQPVPHRETKKGKGKKQNVDTDLVQAYETIYQKSRSAQMKNIARKFLQQNGFINNQPQSNTKKITKQQPKPAELTNRNRSPVKNIQQESQVPRFQKSNFAPISSPNVRPFIHKNKKQKYTYLEQPENNLRSMRIDQPINKYEMDFTYDNIQQSSIIHRLDRSTSRQKNRVSYNIDKSVLDDNIGCRKLRRTNGSRSYDEFGQKDLLMKHLYDNGPYRTSDNWRYEEGIRIGRSMQKKELLQYRCNSRKYHYKL